jgi:tRNA(fMet)-specific endonuclease VapC
LLDTNILVHYVRGDATWDGIRDECQLLLIDPKPLISIVTVAELKLLSMQFHWGSAKLDRMEFLLGYLDEIPIDSRKLVDYYALFDSHLRDRGQKMGKNDLWIAATASLADARLLTTDHDFDRLDPDFLALECVALPD